MMITHRFIFSKLLLLRRILRATIQKYASLLVQLWQFVLNYMAGHCLSTASRLDVFTTEYFVSIGRNHMIMNALGLVIHLNSNGEG